MGLVVHRTRFIIKSFAASGDTSYAANALLDFVMTTPKCIFYYQFFV